MALDKAQIKAILTEQAGGRNHNKPIVYRMLQAMFQRQTADEQAAHSTHHSNGRGFNGRDAEFLSDVAAKSQKWKGLTDGQAKYVAKSLIKYSRQIAEIEATAPGTQVELFN
jgi:hypothetical protein